MRHADAVSFLRPALGPDPGPLWADLGAGSGTFTRALAELLGPDARILAVDRDGGAVRALRDLASDLPDGAARVEPVEADLRRLDAAPALADVALDGALLANVLHFFSDPAGPLADVVARVRPGGRVVVVEYQDRSANPWVPHPLSFEDFRPVAASAGLTGPEVVETRRSRYRGAMYCAVAERPAG